MANTRFQLEGSGPELFERETVPLSARPMAERMFDHVSLDAGDRILDAACGTGIVTRVAVERFENLASIVGLDLNAGMLEVARKHAPTTGIPIEWRQGDMCALPFSDASFDVVVCSQGLQFVPDKLAALREVRRVLVSGGRLAFQVFREVLPNLGAIAESLRRHVSEAAATSCLAPFVLRDAETIRTLMRDAEFNDFEMKELEIIVRRPSSVASMVESMLRMPFARDVAAVSEATRLEMGQEVVDALQAYRDGNEFLIPFRFYLVEARKC